ncbi:putative secreted domain protein (plasmid) [Burkholderia gladioli]|uniref:Secreted domain protein n=1 Tax=Burkholderia gladioli TaxID=28095 RepID=A0AAW3FCB2_BURGA|nr:hypothetical protein [Burkholderia gladioli]AJW93601.1 putative secreted domain protein [Burkholderia gladioli]KGC24008.1 putative secreted domain protein [Burkholderia gladioli]
MKVSFDPDVAMLLRRVAPAGVVWVLLALPSQSVYADDYPCRVALCVPSPTNPWSIAACVPALERLFDDLAHGRGWPTCEGSGVSMNYVNTPFDPCQGGLNEAGPGAWVIEGKKQPNHPTWFYTDPASYGISPSASPQQSAGGDAVANASLACVGKLMGTYRTYVGQYNRDYQEVNVAVYDQIVWQKPQSPWAIDVYQNGQFSRRVHWK